MKSHSTHGPITQDFLAEVHSALPMPPMKGLDYDDLRGRLPYGYAAIRAALKIMIAAGVVTESNGGLRGRKVFQRIAELPQGLAAANVETAPPITTPVEPAQGDSTPQQHRPRAAPNRPPLAGASYPRLAVPQWQHIPTGGNIRNIYEGRLPAQITSVIEQMHTTERS